MANEDWDEALRRIEGARRSGDKRLSLRNLKIDSLPPKVVGMTGLKFIDLAGTGMTDADLQHIAGLTELQSLDLSRTQITDAGLPRIAGMTGLQTIFLSGTQITDLRPLLALPLMTDGRWDILDRLYLSDSAALSDPGVATAMAKSAEEDKRKALLAHLRSLPEWPAPLKGSTSAPAPPEPVIAPLTVDVVEGKLVSRAAGTQVDQQASVGEAWTALREMLEDLEDLRPNIDNAMPRLAKALARVNAALGASPDACAAINLGLHGNRVIALADTASDMLLEEAAAEVASLAAALALHLEHFPDWVAYRDKADTPSFEEVVASIEGIRTLANELRASKAVDTDVVETLDAVVEVAAETPSDPIARNSVMGSTKNVAIALAKWIRDETKDIASGSWSLTKKAITGGIGTGLLALFESSTGVFAQLAITSPKYFGWLKPVLSFFGF